MKQHPEQHDGELYMGNTQPGVLSVSAWRTKRMGRVAIWCAGERTGEVIPNPGDLRPWFILASEVEEAIAEEETKANELSAEIVAVYRKMLKERS